MAKAYLDSNTDTVYVDFGDGVFTVVSPDGDVRTDVHYLPGSASPLMDEQELDTSGIYETGYDEGHRAGYEEGESEGYDAGYEDGSSVVGYDEDDVEAARSEGYDDGYSDGLQAADKSEEE